MRIEIDGVTYPRPVDAIVAVTSGNARALVISGRRTGEETLAAAALAVHAHRRGVAVRIDDHDPVAKVAAQIEIISQVEARLAAGWEDPAAIEPDPYLHRVAKALAGLGFQLRRVQAALAPRASTNRQELK